MKQHSELDPISKLQQSAEKIHDATCNLIKYLFIQPEEEKISKQKKGKKKKEEAYDNSQNP